MYIDFRRKLNFNPLDSKVHFIFYCGKTRIPIHIWVKKVIMFYILQCSEFLSFQKGAHNPNLRQFFSLKLTQKDIDYDLNFH